VRLIAMLREVGKGKQPDDLIFTRGLNHRPGAALRQAVEARLPHGKSEREPYGARPAADGGATNAGRPDSGSAHHANLRLEDHVDVPPLRDDRTQRAAAGTGEARRV
jgi:hypothetical protein